MKFRNVTLVPGLVNSFFCGIKQIIAHYSDTIGADLMLGITSSSNNRGVINHAWKSNTSRHTISPPI